MIIISSFTIQKKEDAMSTLSVSTENSVVSEWDYTFEVNPAGDAISVSKNPNPQKYLLDDQVALINHPLFANGTRGAIKTITRLSCNGSKDDILMIESKNGVSIRASLNQVTKN